MAIQVPGQQPTIQAGIDAAGNGDTVLVAPGTYFENVDFHGKDIVVTSAAGPTATVIDGRLQGPVVSFGQGATRAAVLRGFTLRQGHYTLPSANLAGGVRIDFSSPTVEGNFIVANFGNAVETWSGAPLIRDNVIYANVGNFGAAVFINGNQTGAAAEIIGNWIAANWSTQDGGAIATNSPNDVTISDNLIWRNSATYRGGAYFGVGDTRALFVGNSMVDNTAGEGSAISFTPARASPGVFIGNRIWANRSVLLNSGPGAGATFYHNLDESYFAYNYIVGEPGHVVFRCYPDPWPPPGHLHFLGGDMISTPGSGQRFQDCWGPNGKL